MKKSNSYNSFVCLITQGRLNVQFHRRLTLTPYQSLIHKYHHASHSWGHYTFFLSAFWKRASNKGLPHIHTHTGMRQKNNWETVPILAKKKWSKISADQKKNAFFFVMDWVHFDFTCIVQCLSYKHSKVEFYLKRKDTYSIHPTPRTVFLPMIVGRRFGKFENLRKRFKLNCTSKKFWSTKKIQESDFYMMASDEGSARSAKETTPSLGEGGGGTVVRIVNQFLYTKGYICIIIP